MAIVSPYLSIIVHVNGSKSPVKRPRVAAWIKKQNKTQLYAVYKKLTLDLRTHKVKVKGWEDIPCKCKQESRGGYNYIRQNGF